VKWRWVMWVLLLVFLWVIITHFTEIEKIVETFVEGQWDFLIVAGALQILYYLLYAALYQSAFDTVGIKSSLSELVPLTYASLFVNLAPTAGIGGAALFIYAFKKQEKSEARTTAGLILVQVVDYAVFIPIMTFGIVYLVLHHDLKIYEIVAVCLVFLLIAGLSIVLFLGLSRPERLFHFLVWIQQKANHIALKVSHQSFLEDGWAQKSCAEFADAATALTTHPVGVVRTSVIALMSHLVSMASLYVVFLAFHQPEGPGVIVTGYAMAFLIAGTSVIPQGIGIVEGGLVLIYASLGISVETATAITLSFRGFSFWIPLALGFLLFRRMKLFPE
jgi:uncharacterized protein (TIRG00374 family)